MHLECEVQGIEKGEASSTIFTSKGKFEARYLVFCAGLQADRLARKDGVGLK
jgi:L-2-hydroxyglutarate oxidase